MKKIKKMCAILVSLSMLLSICMPVGAAVSNNEFTYTIYNEKGEFVEAGVLIANNNARASWTTDVELQSGYYVNFRSNYNAFYLDSGDQMTLTYTLNKSGTVACRFMKTSTSTGTGSVWSTTTVTGSGTTVRKTADASTYYYPRISNTGSSTITITNVSFTY